VAIQTQTYTRTAIVLHWLIAACVLCQITLGLWMIGIPKSPPGLRAWWFNVHKSIGITLGVLILVRLLWRLAHRAPPLPLTMPQWQRIAAKASHVLLYACMVTMPLTGYLGSSFTKYPILYFGIRLPHWGWDAPALKELCSQIHLTTVIVFITLIAIHIAAALKHRLVDRDGVFERMFAWPRSVGGGVDVNARIAAK
jgi:cytochrome b561